MGRYEQRWNEGWRKFRSRCQEISQISGRWMGGNHLHIPLSLSLFPFFTLHTLQQTDPYKPIDGLKLKFDDANGPNPFRIIENDHGELLLADDKTKHHYALCQYWKTVNQDVYEYFSDERKAYKISGYKMTFDDAKQFCKNDGGSTVMAMPGTQDDVSDLIDIVDCK